MIVIEHQDERIIANVYGEFSLADFKEFEAIVNEKAMQTDKLDLLVDLSKMLSLTVDTALEDFAFRREHANDFRRIAVVTHSQWVAWSAWLTQIFMQAQTRVFDDENQALIWLDSALENEQKPTFNTLVSPHRLAEHLNDSDWRIIDCRHQLSDTTYGAQAYARGHISGALFMHLDRDLSDTPDGTNGRHPLPDPQTFADLLGSMGISNEMQIIVYDDAGGMIAARLWWMLRWLGHDRVAVLDGGIQNWQRCGHPLTTEVPAYPSATFVPQLRDWVVSTEEVLASLPKNLFCIIDARSPERFRGENETVDPVGGRIPGSRNRYYMDNLNSEGLFCSAAQLHREFLSVLSGYTPKQAVMQCGSGVSACHNLLAMEIGGLPGARLYAGSWSEWCSDPKRPITR